MKGILLLFCLVTWINYSELAGLNDMCDFQQNLCIWKNVTNDPKVQTQWRRFKGETPSTSTGPSVDHTYGTAAGYYLYVEASSPTAKGDKARIESPEIASTYEPCKVTIWYHMYGVHVETLRVIVRDIQTAAERTVWYISGQQGTSWKNKTVVVGNVFNLYKIIIETEKGDGAYGDIAIDDVVLSLGCVSGTLKPDQKTIRLTNGTSYSGRVELLINNVWGTICDDRIAMDEANVICKMLGFTKGAISYHHNAKYGQGSGPIWLDNVDCTGTESSIFNCTHRGIGVANCEHKEDVSVVCNRDGAPESIRLSDGVHGARHMGRLEIEHNGQWGTVCKTGFSIREAGVACSQLGYDGAIELTWFGRGTENWPIWLTNVRCLGNESALAHCSHSVWQNHSCSSHDYDVGIVCNCSSGCAEEGNIRLWNGTSKLDGVLEIYHNHQWGTVCDNNWGIKDATVVCRELGFLRVNQSIISNHPGKVDTGRIWLTDVGCSGNENNLSACYVPSKWNVPNCRYDENVALSCEDNVPINNVRLVINNGMPSSVPKGYLQAEVNGAWRHVCTATMGDSLLKVACHQIGYQYYVRKGDRGSFGLAHVQKLYTNAQCTGSEVKFDDCQSHQWNSIQFSFLSCRAEDPAIICSNTDPTLITTTTTTVQTTPITTISTVGTTTPVSILTTTTGSDTKSSTTHSSTTKSSTTTKETQTSTKTTSTTQTTSTTIQTTSTSPTLQRSTMPSSSITYTTTTPATVTVRPTNMKTSGRTSSTSASSKVSTRHSTINNGPTTTYIVKTTTAEEYEKAGQSQSPRGETTGMIVGLVLGSVVAVIIIVILIVVYKKKKGKRAPVYIAPPVNPPSYTDVFGQHGSQLGLIPYDNNAYRNDESVLDNGVAEFLDRLGMKERLGPIFARERITSNLLYNLTESHLARMGVPMGDAIRIMEKVSQSGPYAEIQDNNTVKYGRTYEGHNQQNQNQYMELCIPRQYEALNAETFNTPVYSPLQGQEFYETEGAEKQPKYDSVALPPLDPRLNESKHNRQSNTYDSINPYIDIEKPYTALGEVALSMTGSQASLQSASSTSTVGLGNGFAEPVPKNFFCPVTKCIMEDPVIAEDGCTYERRAIEGIYDNSPVTGQIFSPNFVLLPNRRLKKKIRHWRKSQKDRRQNLPSNRTSFTGVDC